MTLELKGIAASITGGKLGVGVNTKKLDKLSEKTETGSKRQRSKRGKLNLVVKGEYRDRGVSAERSSRTRAALPPADDE